MRECVESGWGKEVEDRCRKMFVKCKFMKGFHKGKEEQCSQMAMARHEMSNLNRSKPCSSRAFMNKGSTNNN